MIRSRAAVLAIAVVVVFLAGLGLRSVLAQQAGQKLPPDVDPTSLARIPWPPKADCCPLGTPEEQQAYDKSNATAEAKNKPASIGVGGMRAYFPLGAQAYGESTSWLDKESKLEARYSQLAACMGAREIGAGGYREWFIHARAAKQAGVPDVELEIIRLQKDTKGLPEKDAVLIQFGREMVRGPKVSPKTFAEMERLFGRRGTLAVAFQVMRYAGLALMSRAYDVQLEPGQTPPFPEK